MDESQKKALAEFKSKNQSLVDSDPVRFDDFYLSRWLIACVWDIEATQKMFDEDLKWREDEQIAAKVKAWGLPDSQKRIFLEKYYPTGIVGTDKRGGPVYMERIGKFDSKSLLKCVTVEEYTIHHLFQIENGERIKREVSKKTNDMSLRKHIVILDIEGLGMEHLDSQSLELTRSLIQLDEAHYPEGMLKMFIINAPWIFHQIYKLVKPIISERTAKKIEVHGTDFYPKLLELMAEDQIPKQFGGKGMVVGDGGKVPESYFMPTSGADDFEDKTIECWLPRAGVHEVRIAVTADALLKYEFWSTDYDIGFAIAFLAKGATDRVMSQAMQRYDSHLKHISGTVTSPAEGSFVMIFDNSFSTFRKKQAFYKISIPTSKGPAQYVESDVGTSASTSDAAPAVATQ